MRLFPSSGDFHGQRQSIAACADHAFVLICRNACDWWGVTFQCVYTLAFSPTICGVLLCFQNPRRSIGSFPRCTAGPVCSGIRQRCHRQHNYNGSTASSAHCHINSCSWFPVKQASGKTACRYLDIPWSCFSDGIFHILITSSQTSIPQSVRCAQLLFMVRDKTFKTNFYTTLGIFSPLSPAAWNKPIFLFFLSFSAWAMSA